MLCEKEYHKHLAAQIRTALPCSTYVIKPLYEFKGRGVVMVEAKDLDAVLYKALYEYQVLHANEKPKHKNESMGHWKRDKGRYFLIEEYCPSKTIVVSDRKYDPTMRAVFILYYHQGKLLIHYLDAFWKVPLQALDDQCRLTKKYKSFGLNPGYATEEEKKEVFGLLDQCLPKLYTKMLYALKHGSVASIPPSLKAISSSSYRKYKNEPAKIYKEMRNA